MSLCIAFSCLAAEPKNCALFHKTMKLSTHIVLLVGYSAITDLTFGDLYGNFKTEGALILASFP